MIKWLTRNKKAPVSTEQPKYKSTVSVMFETKKEIRIEATPFAKEKILHLTIAARAYPEMDKSFGYMVTCSEYDGYATGSSEKEVIEEYVLGLPEWIEITEARHKRAVHNAPSK